MDPIWRNSYSPGVPHEIDADEFVSIPEVFASSIERFGARPAFGNLGKILSFAEMDALTRSVAAYLQQRLKLLPGERIALMLPNVLQQPVMTFAALRIGLIVVNVNPLYTARELEHQLNDSECTALVVLEGFTQVVEEVLQETRIQHVIVTRVGDLLDFPKSLLVNLFVKHIKRMRGRHRIRRAIPFRVARTEGEHMRLDPVHIESDDIAFLQYTGGTTGIAKGAMLTHRNMVANMQQTTAWLSQEMQQGDEVVITALPLYHIFALTANCMTFMKAGGLNYLITDPRDLPRFISELRTVTFTGMTGVNTLFNALLHTPGFEELDFSHFRLALGGGMAVQRAVAEEWESVTGRPLLEAYGLTEAAPAVCINPVDLPAYNGKIGLPIPSTECTIRDDAGTELAIGEAGELWIRGPQVMKGYWNRPKATSEVLTPDGWLRTGDIAKIDAQGFVELVDRKKDMIIVSGFNVYPNEIEDVVAAHPGVLEVAAIGVPDAHSNETVKLFVVPKDPELNKEQIREFCKESLTGYKRPKQIEFRSTLPKSTVGKILRRALRDAEGADLVPDRETSDVATRRRHKT